MGGRATSLDREYESGECKAYTQVGRMNGDPYSPRTRRNIHPRNFPQHHTNTQKEKPRREQKRNVLPHCHRYEVMNNASHDKRENQRNM